MNALAIGGLIFLFVILSNTVAAFIETQTVVETTVPGCEQGQNITECNDVAETDFVQAVLQVTVQGITGAPDWFNNLWLLVNVFLLVLAGILIVTYFIGLPFGGSG